MTKPIKLLISALGLAAIVFAGAAVAQNNNIAIATGGTGGVYYPLGGGMANVLSRYVKGVQATARVTGGSVDNLRLIHSGQSEVALVMVEVAGGRVVAEADVHADVGGGQLLAIPGADDLDRLAEQGQRRDGEDVVGVEGAVVGGDPQD